jgi:hypothetical protein
VAGDVSLSTYGEFDVGLSMYGELNRVHLARSKEAVTGWPMAAAHRPVVHLDLLLNLIGIRC